MSVPVSMRRLGWFVALWAGGIACLTAVALPLRWLLKGRLTLPVCALLKLYARFEQSKNFTPLWGHAGLGKIGPFERHPIRLCRIPLMRGRCSTYLVGSVSARV